MSAASSRLPWGFSLLLLLALALPGRGQTTDPILRTVDDHYNHLSSLRARYTETYAGMGIHRSESGTLTLRKPGRMRWDYDSPAGKVFLLDGKSAWFYTPGDPQAQRLPAKQLDDLRTPLRFLLGHTQLAKELTQISVTGEVISGVPRGLENRVKSLTLTVTPAGQITAMRIEELDGAVTSFAFSNIQENIPTRDADFTFTAPPGVTIVNATPPM